MSGHTAEYCQVFSCMLDVSDQLSMLTVMTAIDGVLASSVWLFFIDVIFYTVIVSLTSTRDIF